MDYSNALGAEFREVRETSHDGKPARAVIASRAYRADIHDVWDALTSAERIPRWFLPISGELKEGGRYQLEGHAGGTILTCEPPASLALTWEVADNVSCVTVKLETAEQGTLLTLDHTMLKDQAGEAHWKQFGPGATGVGWDLALVGLQLHIDNDGAQVDQEQAFAWMASEPGKAFIRNCATKWGDAHVDSGESAAIATAIQLAVLARLYSGD